MNQGIMSSPKPKPGKTLNEVTVEVVNSFYNRDEVSRVMPDKKRHISIKVSAVKIHERKRLLLCNLKELYSHFKNSHPRSQSKLFEVCILASQKLYYGRCKWYTHCMYVQFTKM
jgi:hypothetical protein